MIKELNTEEFDVLGACRTSNRALTRSIYKKTLNVLFYLVWKSLICSCGYSIFICNFNYMSGKIS